MIKARENVCHQHATGSSLPLIGAKGARVFETNHSAKERKASIIPDYFKYIENIHYMVFLNFFHMKISTFFFFSLPYGTKHFREENVDRHITPSVRTTQFLL